MLAIMGASGNTGGSALEELRRRGVRVRALSRTRPTTGRDDGQVEWVQADPADAESLTAALGGCQAAYVLIPPYLRVDDVLAAGLTTARAIAQAVRRAQVRHVVALSSGGVHLTHGIGPIRSMRELEEALRQTDASLTFIRAADFMENWAEVAPVVRAQGVLPSGRLPLDRPMQTVSTIDIGRLVARCLLEPLEGLRIINLLGPADYTPNDVGRAFAAALDRQVQVVPVPREELPAAFEAGGIGRDYAARLLEIYDGLNAGRIGFEPGVGEVRRGTVTIEEAVRAMLRS